MEFRRPVEQFENTDNLAFAVYDRHAEDVPRPVLQGNVEGSVETGVGVGVGNVDDPAGGGNRARDAVANPDPYLDTFHALRNDRAKFVVLAIHDKNSAAVHTDFLADDLQDDAGELRQVDGGVQQLNRFENPSESADIADRFKMAQLGLGHNKTTNSECIRHAS